MKQYLIYFCLLSVVSNIQAESVTIYKFLDEKGVLHLSNKPPQEQDDLLYSRSYVVQSFAPQTITPLIIPIPKVIADMPSVKIAKKVTPSRTVQATDYDDFIATAATQFNLPPSLLYAVIKVESNFNPNAVSPKGAIGLMQIIPDTGSRYGATDLADPQTNIQCGANYLSDLLDLFNQNLTLALAAYNAGENAVLRYGNKVPPYAETQAYVNKVTKLYQELAANP